MNTITEIILDNIKKYDEDQKNNRCRSIFNGLKIKHNRSYKKREEIIQKLKKKLKRNNFKQISLNIFHKKVTCIKIVYVLKWVLLLKIIDCYSDHEYELYYQTK